jgi:hypothetical protein
MEKQEADKELDHWAGHSQEKMRDQFREILWQNVHLYTAGRQHNLLKWRRNPGARKNKIMTTQNPRKMEVETSYYEQRFYKIKPN